MMSRISSLFMQFLLPLFTTNFLDIGNHYPVSLFSGFSYLAAIGSEGEAIFINNSSVIKSPNSQMASVSLPGGEKASSFAIQMLIS